MVLVTFQVIAMQLTPILCEDLDVYIRKFNEYDDELRKVSSYLNDISADNIESYNHGNHRRGEKGISKRIFAEKYTENLNHNSTSSSNRISETFKTHNVKKTLIDEINNMAASSIPREYIISHVGSHYPDKSESEWNDIVISSLNVYGKHAPKQLRYKRSMENSIQVHRARYEALKKTHEYKKQQILKMK